MGKYRKNKGMDNILNPVHNAVAAINYIKKRRCKPDIFETTYEKVDWTMKRKEYQRHANQLVQSLIKFQIDNDIEEEWFLRMLIETIQSYTVRFPKV